MTQVNSPYDDRREEYYHFPKTYENQAKATVGDWIVYYEPGRTGGPNSKRNAREAYFAVANVTDVRPDPQLDDHFYADVRDYLEFDRTVPFREGAHYFEAALQRGDGGTNKGAFGRSVRNMPDAEFELILNAGFAPLLGVDSTAQRAGLDLPDGFDDEPASFERPIVERLTRRPFRDAAFALAVKRAYADTCALTGLKIINGGGRTEAQAAHIRPVKHSGPDSVRNGLALTTTAHWMFDRGLVSVADDLTILTAGSAAPEALSRLLLPSGRMQPPKRPEWLPHPQFLRWHRENVFKG